MRLIDADELMEKFYDIEFNAKHELFGVSRDLALEGLKHIKKALKGMPTIDTVKHGHWIIKGNGNADCSCCGYRSSRVYDDDNADRYCRHCGAKMDGDGK